MSDLRQEVRVYRGVPETRQGHSLRVEEDHVVPHKPTCTDKSKWKHVKKRWLDHDRGGGDVFREQWATKECKTCGGNLGDVMVKSHRKKK